MKAMKDSTRLIIFSSVFCVLTLVFFLLFQFEVISNLPIVSSSPIFNPFFLRTRQISFHNVYVGILGLKLYYMLRIIN